MNPERNFKAELLTVLRTPAARLSPRKRDRIADDLHPALWKAVLYVRDHGDSTGEILRKRAADALDRADKAKAIAKLASKLLRALPDSRVVATYLDGWSFNFADVRSNLLQVQQNANAVSDEQKRAARLPLGRRMNWTRINLSKWVAIQLCISDIRPTKAKTGVFARLLCVVQKAAGFHGRALSNIERDVRRALSDAEVVSRLRKDPDGRKPGGQVFATRGPVAADRTLTSGNIWLRTMSADQGDTIRQRRTSRSVASQRNNQMSNRGEEGHHDDPEHHGI